MLSIPTLFKLRDSKRHIFEKLETYKDLFDNAHDLIHLLEPGGQIIYVNKAWTRILGYSEEEITGRSIYSFVHESDRARFVEYRTNIVREIDSPPEVVVRLISKRGGVVHVEGFVSSKVVSGQPLYTRGIFRDITVKIQNEGLLRSANQKLRVRESNLEQLLFHAPDAIIVADTESKIQYWNPKSELVFGWKSSEVLGKRLTDIIIPVKYRDAHEQGMKRYVTTGDERVLNRTIEITAINRSGKEFYVALTISATLQNEKPAFIAFIRDIDDQKRIERELEQKRSQLEVSNEQLEQFAHVASHDMKEPIRKIRLFSDQLKEDKVNVFSAKSRQYLVKIENAAFRLTQMVDGVLAFSSLRGEKLVTEKVDLNAIIKTIETDLELPVEQKRAVIKYSELPCIQGAAFLIYQLFYNLVNNSLKFSKEGTQPLIEIAGKKMSREELRDNGLSEDVSHYQISVRDNGIGFRQEDAETIFKVFARLHPSSRFEGTGLGLSLCKTIVEKHKGMIVAQGVEGAGATFCIMLPEFQE